MALDSPPARISPRPEILAIALVVVGGLGGTVSVFGFFIATLTSIDRGNSTVIPWVVLFFVACVAFLAGVVLGIIRLARGPHRALAAVAVALAVPVVMLSLWLTFAPFFSVTAP